MKLIRFVIALSIFDRQELKHTGKFATFVKPGLVGFAGVVADRFPLTYLKVKLKVSNVHILGWRVL
jgi:hypothetical protein